MSENQFFLLFQCGVPLLLGAAGLAFFRWWARGQPPRVLEASRLLNQGRYAQALELFLQLGASLRSDPVAAFNIGLCRLHLWQLESAATQLELARQLSGENTGALVALLPEHLALTYALLGRSADAQASLAAVPTSRAYPGRLALVTAIILARTGDPAGARSKLASFEAKQLGGVMGALARTVDAFCVELLTSELRHVDRVALFGETGADGLSKAWPELIAFVERAPVI